MPKGIYQRSKQAKLNISKSKIGSIPWNKGMSGVIKASEETKAKLSKLRIGNTNNAGKKRSIETRRKFSESFPKGEAHWSWKGGKKRSRSGDLEYRLWRTSIFERDDYTCLGCGERGCYLEAHHIKSWANYPSLRYDLSNGQTLCKDCHAKTDNYKGKCK